MGHVLGVGVAVHAPDPSHQRAGVLAKHFVAIEVETGGHLHGAAEEAFGTGEVEAGAHRGVAEQVIEVVDQCLVAGVHPQWVTWVLLQLGEVVLAGK
ncbi:hypothetical protein D3C76_1571240 [compost metagenome]